MEGLGSVEYEYDYPSGLDLSPGSDAHKNIVSRVMTRARESRRIMSRRHEEWRGIDRNLRMYVPPEMLDDSSSGVYSPKIIMPHMYATLETLLTYMNAAFLQDPIIKYEGVGPEDQLGGELMTHLNQKHSHKFGHGLALHTMWRDSFAYGVGAITPVWEREMGYKTVMEEVGYLNWVSRQFLKTGEQRARGEWELLYEGNKLVNIDPYRLLPDPNTSAHEIQEGEFFGFIDRGNTYEYLKRERNNNDHIFNAKYLKHFKPTSSIDIEDGKTRGRHDRDEYISTNNPCDVIWMYCEIIPSEWGLGSSQYPEKWFFGVAGDQVLITAMPLGMHHNMFPAVVAAPDYDGYSLDPPSRLGLVQDVQTVMNFLYSSHLQNIMKVINDMFVVDPSLVNIEDLSDPKPGKLIRMRRKAWGRGGVKDAVSQLDVRDVTQNHVADTTFLDNLMKQSSGANDPVQGNIGRRTSRISASEFQGARGSSLSRLEKTARTISMQAMQPLGRMLASNIQQFMEQETFVKATGEWAQVLQDKYSAQVESDRISISPRQMIVDYDITPHDGTIPGSEDVGTWVQLFQIMSQNPEVGQNFNVVKTFQHIAHQMGAKNLEKFVRQDSEPIQVQPDEDVQEQVQRGNLVAV
jgi:hypothetical protein